METMAAVEDLVATLVTNLGDEIDNTYIIFTSDNGWHAGEHYLPADKRTPYEEDLRVPLLVRGPGVVAGSSLPQLVTNLDLASTILDIADAEAGVPQEGQSLLPLLTGSTSAEWRSAFLVEYDAADTDDMPSWSGVRTDRYTYIEWADGFVELYDLQDDPAQLINRSDAQPALVRELGAIHDRLTTCAGAECFYRGP
jgi:arylsulfatase A-like enzyme